MLTIHSTPCLFPKHEQADLAHSLKQIIFICKDLESFRIDLALKHDFNLQDAFHLFDTADLGCINLDNLAQGLKHNLQFGEFCEEDLFLFMRRVDYKGLRRITFRQFYDTVLPFTTEYATRV